MRRASPASPAGVPGPGAAATARLDASRLSAARSSSGRAMCSGVVASRKLAGGRWGVRAWVCCAERGERASEHARAPQPASVSSRFLSFLLACSTPRAAQAAYPGAPAAAWWRRRAWPRRRGRGGAGAAGPAGPPPARTPSAPRSPRPASWTGAQTGARPLSARPARRRCPAVPGGGGSAHGAAQLSALSLARPGRWGRGHGRRRRAPAGPSRAHGRRTRAAPHARTAPAAGQAPTRRPPRCRRTWGAAARGERGARGRAVTRLGVALSDAAKVRSPLHSRQSYDGAAHDGEGSEGARDGGEEGGKDRRPRISRKFGTSP